MQVLVDGIELDTLGPILLKIDILGDGSFEAKFILLLTKCELSLFATAFGSKIMPPFSFLG